MKAAGTLLVAILVMIPTSCSDGGTDGELLPETTTEDTVANPLAETTWHLLSIELDDELTEFSGSAVPTLEFTDDTLMMSDGVNTARGPYTFDGDQLSVGPLASTLVGTPEPTGPESELIGLLDRDSEARVGDGQLVIEVDSGQLTYAAGPAEADEVELADTSWSLTDIARGNKSINATLAPVPAVVTFGRGTVDAYDGVNTATGTFDQDGTDVSVELEAPGEIAVTGETYPQYELFELLSRVESAELVDEGSLLLRTEEGSLRFDPVGAGISDS